MSNIKQRMRKSKSLLPVLLLIGLISGVVLAQIFSNQLSYQLRVKDDNERYSLTEVEATISDLWGSGGFNLKVFIEKHYDPGTSRLNCEIVNLDGKNISITDVSAQKEVIMGDGTPWTPLGDLSTGGGGGIIQGSNASSVIVYGIINFSLIDTSTTMYMRLVVGLLPGIASGDYQVTLYVFSP